MMYPTRKWRVFLLATSILAAILAACNLPISKPSDVLPKLEMSAATMAIQGTEVTDSFPPGCSSGPACHKPKAGFKILIVWLEREDGGDVDEIRDKLFGETLPFLMSGGSDKACVIAGDGSKAGLAVAHVMDDGRFALVFALPESARDLKLIWPGNPEIDLGA